MTSQVIFPQDRVERYTANNFHLGTATPIAIRNKDVTFIMFYLPNDILSLRAARVFREAAKSYGAVIFASVDCSANGEREVAQSFLDNANTDNPTSRFTLDGFPTFILYRQGWPQAYYNGQISVNAIRNWLFVASRQGYSEYGPTKKGIIQEDTNFDRNYFDDTGEEDPLVTIVEDPRSSGDLPGNSTLYGRGIANTNLATTPPAVDDTSRNIVATDINNHIVKLNEQMSSLQAQLAALQVQPSVQNVTTNISTNDPTVQAPNESVTEVNVVDDGNNVPEQN
jgi:hypothetical protein